MLLEEGDLLLNTVKTEEDTLLKKLQEKIAEYPIIDNEKVNLIREKFAHHEISLERAQKIAQKILHLEEALFPHSSAIKEQ